MNGWGEFMGKVGIISLLIGCVAINLIAMENLQKTEGTVVANYTPYRVFLWQRKEGVIFEKEIVKVVEGEEIVLTHYTLERDFNIFSIKMLDACGNEWFWNIQNSVPTTCYTYTSSRLRTLQIFNLGKEIKIVCYFPSDKDDEVATKREFVMEWTSFRE